MNCLKCGKPVGDNKFCPYCGSGLGKTQSEEKTNEQSAPAKVSSAGNVIKVIFATTLSIIALTVLGLIVYKFVISDSQAKNNDDGSGDMPVVNKNASTNISGNKNDTANVNADSEADDSSEDDHSHTFWLETGDVCQICGIEFPAERKAYNGEVYSVENGMPIRNFYYGTGKSVRKLTKGESVEATGIVINQKGNIWYVIGDEGYIFSDNVSESYVDPGNEEWHSHVFEEKTGDVCTVCGLEFIPEKEELNGTYYAIKDDVMVRSFYYNSGTAVRYLDKGESVEVTYSLQNQKGSVWYYVGDGYVYSANLTDIEPAE